MLFGIDSLPGLAWAQRSQAISVLQLLSGNMAPKGSVLSLDPIVKDQARMGSSNMPGGSTPVSSASMMSGEFCYWLFSVHGILKHLHALCGCEDPGGWVLQVGH